MFDVKFNFIEHKAHEVFYGYLVDIFMVPFINDLGICSVLRISRILVFIAPLITTIIVIRGLTFLP